MTRRRVVAIGLAAVGLAISAVVRPGVPPAAKVVDLRGWRADAGAHVVRGAYHVHTSRSDGTGSIDEVARAAARRGLDFVIFADHGDGRDLQPPSYHSGVLCLDAVEVSTHGGHYVAIGMASSPYPLGGEARDVVDDVTRLGGLGIVAHPDSTKRALAWTDWTLPVDGFEWLSADSEWRDEGRAHLARAMVFYAWRGPESVVSLFDRPATTLSRWDEWGSRGRRLVGLAALDAHARLGPRADDEDDRTASDFSVRVPSYDVLFGTLSTRVELPGPLANDPRTDAISLVEALRAGRVYTVLDAVAGPGALAFYADGPEGRLRMGDTVSPGAGSLRIHLRVAAPPGSRLVLRRNGRTVAETTGTGLEFVTPQDEEGSAAYRAEVVAEGAPGHPPVPWIVTNPIYVGLAPTTRSATGVAAEAAVRQLLSLDERALWHVEHDPGSRAEVSLMPAAEGDGAELTFGFTLSSGARNVWSAAARDLSPALGQVKALRFEARATNPLRFSVQLRAGSSGEDVRWRRSVYVDERRRAFDIPLDDFRPAVPTMRRDHLVADAHGLLFVVDRPNAAGGATGTVWIRDLRLVQ